MEDRNKIINNFYVSHSVWLHQCAYNLTSDEDVSYDLVHNVLLKIIELPEDRFEKVIYQGQDLNTYYVYQSMKNLYTNNVTRGKEDTKEATYWEINEEVSDYVSDEQERLREQLLQDINAYLDSMEQDNKLWFDSKLFRVYLNENHSMESLSKHTGISKSTIFTSLKRIKTHLKDKFKTQYNQLQDYE